MIDFSGRTAIVTGAARGLGRGYVDAIAARGGSVVVNDLDGEEATRAANAIVAAGGRAIADNSDVADPAAARHLVAAALDAFGAVDVVINNAGILRDRSFAKQDLDDFAKVATVHLLGAANVTHAAWPHMAARGYGRVVLTASHAGMFGSFGQSAYAAAKLGLIGLMNTLKLEGAKAGIAVNTIVPLAATRMFEGTALAAIADRLPIDDVVAAVLWLASETCAHTGVALVAGGGRVSRALVVETAGVAFDRLTPEALAERAEDILAITPALPFEDAGRAVAARLAGPTA